MTIWMQIQKARQLPVWVPQRHDPARQLWRDFSTIAVQRNNDKKRSPGIVAWITQLRAENVLNEETMVRFRSVSVQYDRKKSSITDTFSDTLSFHVDLLTEAGAIWRQIVESEIRYCDEAAGSVGLLAERLGKAAGGVDDRNAESQKSEARARFYSAIDAPFRDWLQRLKPEQTQSERNALQDAWAKTVRRIALRFGQELVDGSGVAAYVGRNVTEKVKGKDVTNHYSAPEAFGAFKYRINKLYPQEVK